MKKQILTLLLMLAAFSTCFAQSATFIVQLNGANKNLVGRPYSVTIQGKDLKETDLDVTSDGYYEFSANAGDYFVIRNTVTNKVFRSLLLSADKAGKETSIAIDNADKAIDLKSGASVSTSNYWLGASLSYNLDGGSTDDIIGGAKIVINPSSVFSDTSRHALNVIGNIGTFSSNTTKDDGKSALAKLAQSQSGLSLGLGYQIGLGKNLSSTGRKYPAVIEATTGYRLNSFTDPKADSLSVGLSQLRTTVMLEFALGRWKNGGELTLSFEGSMSNFSKSTYNRIFNEEKSSRFGFETTIIIPVSASMGFMANVIAAQSMKPVYQFGFAIKTSSGK